MVEWMQTEPVPHAFIFNVPTDGWAAAANTLKKPQCSALQLLLTLLSALLFQGRAATFSPYSVTLPSTVFTIKNQAVELEQENNG